MYFSIPECELEGNLQQEIAAGSATSDESYLGEAWAVEGAICSWHYQYGRATRSGLRIEIQDRFVAAKSVLTTNSWIDACQVKQMEVVIY